MKLVSLQLENFRGYSEFTTIDLNDLTCLVGRNDAGKSTILEALDFFFNEGGSNGIIKVDKDDCSIGSGKEEILIGATFTNLPDKVILDKSVETSLKDEFLLNKDGMLQVNKIIKNGRVISTKLIANYPTGKPNVHSLKISDLRKLLKEMNLSVEDDRISSLCRKAILSSYSKEELEEIEIETKSEGGKDIWEGLKKYLPVYTLFQSDRKNQDKDGEIQDPMKQAVKETLSNRDIIDKLDNISTEVINAVKDVTKITLEKLAEMNPEIAKELEPDIPKKIEWDKVFNFGLRSDNGIPLNKRGSGVRRMILLNFFRAQAEKRRSSDSSSTIIYAYEEPETSQHPDYQKKLIDSFIELSKGKNTQIIFTTHSPEICNMVPIEYLRLIDRNLGKEFKVPTENILDDIANALGVLPGIAVDIEKNVRKVKVAVCVEGKLDINFLRNINNNIPEIKEIIDLDSKEIIMIPMGGSTLKDWVNERYLEKLELNQVHIYDSDIGSKNEHKYKNQVSELNQKNSCKAFETKLREMENYICPIILQDIGIEFKQEHLDNWDRLDIGEYCAKYNYENNPDSTKKWSELTDDTKDKKIKEFKKKINKELSTRLTKSMLEDMHVFDEIIGWFNSIKEFAN